MPKPPRDESHSAESAGPRARIPSRRPRATLAARLDEVTPFRIVSGVTVAALVLFILFPLGFMVTRAVAPEGVLDLSAYRAVTTQSWFPGMLISTIVVIASSGAIAIVVASTFAWLNERTDARLGVLGELLPVIPLLLPAVAMAIGWVLLASPRSGFLNGLLGWFLSPLGIEWQLNIFSWYGLVFVYVLYFVPYVYLLVVAALRNVDPALEEASQVCGAGLLRTLRTVSLPSIRPAMFGGGFLAVIVGMALFSIPVIIATGAGIDMLSVRIVRFLTVEFPARTSEALVLSTIMIAVIGSMWLLQRRVVGSGRFAMIGGRAGSLSLINLGVWKWPARALMVSFVLASAVLPVGALLVVALQPFWTPSIDLSVFNLDDFRWVVRPANRSALINSVQLGVAGGLITMVMATMVALYTRDNYSMSARFSDIIPKVPAAVSNIVVGIGFLLIFSGPPFNLSGTLSILLLCFIVAYMPQASIAGEVAVAQVGRDLFEASFVSGAGEGRTTRRVAVPLMIPGLAAGWALVFVLVAGDLAVSALLAGRANPTVGLVILNMFDIGTWGKLAALSFTFVCITSTVVMVVFRLARPRYRRGS